MYNWSTLKKLIWLYAAKIRGGAQAIIETITGTLPLVLQNALSHAILSLTRYGLCVQDGTPTPDAPVPILCNNGKLTKSANLVDVNGQTPVNLAYVANKLVTNSERYGYYINVKPNTKYTISINRGKTGAYLNICDTTSVPANNVSVQAYNTMDGTTSAKTITTKANTNYLYVYTAYMSGYHPLERGDFQIEEGETASTYHPFVYVDGTPEVLTVRGINLADPSLVTSDGWYVNGGVVDASNTNRTICVPCKPNTKYSFWHCSVRGGCRAFDVPTETITRGQSATWLTENTPTYKDANAVTTVTTRADAKLLCVLYGRRDTGSTEDFETQFADFMLVEGEVSTATDYEPYHAQTASVPMLLSVGDSKDEGELISGIKTGKVGIKVLTGDNSKDGAWGTSGGASNLYSLTIAGSSTDNAFSPLSTHFVGVLGNVGYASIQDGQFKHGSNSNVYYFKDTSSADVTAFKAFLAAQYAAGTPVIVLYPLATETTEQTTAQHLVTHQGTNIVDSTANVGPVEAKVEYYASESTTPPLLGMMRTTEPQDEPEAAEESSEPEESEESSEPEESEESEEI